MISRYRLINPEVLDDYFEHQQSVIILSQHYNNWEWGSICLGLQTQHRIVGVIKKISNKYIHDFVAKARSQNNVSVVNADDAAKYLRYHKPNKPEGIVLIADQYPYNRRHRTTAPFFDHEIDFHSGTGLIASWTDYPIFSIDIHKIKRGHYKLELVKLVDKASDSSPQEITSLYASHLESLIQKSPPSWLWSHKRFKGDIKY
jgi:KDO2-lipid IV(A) lauroyltransferase